MAFTGVKLNSAGIRQVLKSPEVAAELKVRAERVAQAAIASAPVETGAYQGSIHVEMVEYAERVVAQIRASDWKSHIIEANTGNLARALDAAG